MLSARHVCGVNCCSTELQATSKNPIFWFSIFALEQISDVLGDAAGIGMLLCLCGVWSLRCCRKSAPPKEGNKKKRNQFEWFEFFVFCHSKSVLPFTNKQNVSCRSTQLRLTYTVLKRKLAQENCSNFKQSMRFLCLVRIHMAITATQNSAIATRWSGRCITMGAHGRDRVPTTLNQNRSGKAFAWSLCWEVEASWSFNCGIGNGGSLFPDSVLPVQKHH